MSSTDFRGRDALVASIDAAIADAIDARELVARLSQDLQTLLHSGGLSLPAHIFQPVQGHYARRELHRSTAHGYSVIAMTWAPMQGTPLHDHDGQWCVEGVIAGELEITDHALLESDGDLHRFAQGERMRAVAGSSSGLCVPDEYHVVRNPSAEVTTVSLHVYQRAMERCHVFEPIAERPGWYVRNERRLATD